MFVLDASAIVAMFDAYEPLMNLWFRADRGDFPLAFPAAAIVEADDQAGIRPTAWEPVLWSPSMKVLPLDEAAATTVSAWSGSLAVRQAIWESEATGWPVLTCDPGQYAAEAYVLAV